MFDREGFEHKAYSGFRSGMDVGMGVIYILVGSIAFYWTLEGILNYNKAIAYMISTLIVLYGVFRVYRGATVLLQRGKKDRDI